MMTLQAREWSNRTPQLTNKPTEDGTCQSVGRPTQHLFQKPHPMASGVYFCRLLARPTSGRLGVVSQTRKMILLR